MPTETVEFDQKKIKEYLDTCITHWRNKKREGTECAAYYIDAFQSVRVSLFGEMMP